MNIPRCDIDDPYLMIAVAMVIRAALDIRLTTADNEIVTSACEFLIGDFARTTLDIFYPGANVDRVINQRPTQ